MHWNLDAKQYADCADNKEAAFVPEGGKRFMLPDVNHPVWVEFVTGRKPLHSTKATINMLVHNNKSSYEHDPSPENIKKLVARTHDFLTQFQTLFAVEVAEILK
jgi:hypothetical protein